MDCGLVAGFIAGIVPIQWIRFHLLLRALARTVLLVLLRMNLVSLLCLIVLICFVGVLILILLVHNDVFRW